MKRLAFALLLPLALGFTGIAAAQEKKVAKQYPPKLEGSAVETYKTVGDTKLNLYVYNPPGHKPSDKRAAIVFFFGGGWTNGSPQQFEEHCKHLASRGMVAMTADYRVGSRHQSGTCDLDGDRHVRARQRCTIGGRHDGDLGLLLR